jgi:hypothetical protein
MKLDRWGSGSSASDEIGVGESGVPLMSRGPVSCGEEGAVVPDMDKHCGG